jgi:hypothetical protein
MITFSRVMLISLTVALFASISTPQKSTKSSRPCPRVGAPIQVARNLLGPSGEPDELYERAGAKFEYFKKDDVSIVFSQHITILNDSHPGFSYADGAQRIDLMLFRTFAGKKPPLDSILFIFESRSACLLLASTTGLKLIADGEIVCELKASLANRIEATVTWEDSFAEIPFPQLERFVNARERAHLHLGEIDYQLSANELAGLRSFVQAIREAAK